MFILRYFVLTRTIAVFSCEKTLMNTTHIRKGIAKFLHMVSWIFMITTKVRLYHSENMLITTKSGARQS